MKTKLFPPPVAPYDVLGHVAKLRAEELSKIDPYPWAPRVLAVLLGGVVWGLIFVLVLCVWLSGNSSFGDVSAAFALGFIIPVVISSPFLWR